MFEKSPVAATDNSLDESALPTMLKKIIPTLREIISRTFLSALFLMAGCAPQMSVVKGNEIFVPQRFQNASAQSTFDLPQKWWHVYNDPVLDKLVENTLRDNPNLHTVYARLAAARAQVRATSADRLPQLGVSANAMNSHLSATTPLGLALGGQSIEGNQFSVNAHVAWEADLWGKIANAVKVTDAKVRMAKIEVDAYTLIMCSEVVAYYWQVRGAEAELAILADMRKTLAHTEDLLANRFSKGLSNEVDLEKARIELANIDAEIKEAQKRRFLAEHGLATLTGLPIAEFSVAPIPDIAHQLPPPPSIAPGLPAGILARRPDLATSEQEIRAGMVQKEIAKAAFYPSIQLTSDWGYASKALSDLLESASRQFSIGPLAVSLPIFDGGRNRANLSIAEARYQEAIAKHKSQLLIALREVDDALTEIRFNEEQVKIRQNSLNAAKKTMLAAQFRYQKGLANYLDVIDAERSALAVERRALQNRTQALLATVQLVRSLGGSWNAGEWEDHSPKVTGEPEVK